MNCEYCLRSYENIYGSGRFCSSKCARGFSTSFKRDVINQQVSLKMQGRTHSDETKSKIRQNWRGHIFTNDDREKAILLSKNKAKGKSFDLASSNEKRRRILEEQNNNCLCGIHNWNDKNLVLELDHIDGDKKNNKRENLRMLCPNCHSQTPTFRRRKGI